MKINKILTQIEISAEVISGYTRSAAPNVLS